MAGRANPRRLRQGRRQDEFRETFEIEGVPVVPLAGLAAPTMTNRGGSMESVEPDLNHRPTARFYRGREFVSERRLAGGIDAIDRHHRDSADANREQLCGESIDEGRPAHAQKLVQGFQAHSDRLTAIQPDSDPVIAPTELATDRIAQTVVGSILSDWDRAVPGTGAFVVEPEPGSRLDIQVPAVLGRACLEPERAIDPGRPDVGRTRAAIGSLRLDDSHAV